MESLSFVKHLDLLVSSFQKGQYHVSANMCVYCVTVHVELCDFCCVVGNCKVIVPLSVMHL